MKVNPLDVIKEIQAKLKNQFANANFYILKSNETFIKPAFFFSYINIRNKNINYFLKRTVLDIQIIYLGLGSDPEERFKVSEKIDSILGTLNISVKDRNLKFEYSYGEVDGNISINLEFEYLDDRDTEINLGQTDLMEKIFLNESEV